MDRERLIRKLKEQYEKYKYVLLILLLGIFLMALPQKQKNDRQPEQSAAVPEDQSADSMEKRLEAILSQVDGAGGVRVLLTEAAGEEIIYQTDLAPGMDGTSRVDTVIISGSSRAEGGLVRQINPPTYLGAIILCQGAKSAAVRLAITEAVANATGLRYDRITILKLK